MCAERKSFLESLLVTSLQTSTASKDFDIAKHSRSCKYRYCSFCVPVFICFNISSFSLVVFLSAHSALRGERWRKKKKKGFTPALFVSAPYMSWGLSYQECFLLHLHITGRRSLSSLLLTRTHNRSCFLSPPAQIRPEPNHSGGTYWAKTELTAKLSAC